MFGKENTMANIFANGEELLTKKALGNTIEDTFESVLKTGFPYNQTFNLSGKEFDQDTWYPVQIIESPNSLGEYGTQLINDYNALALRHLLVSSKIFRSTDVNLKWGTHSNGGAIDADSALEILYTSSCWGANPYPKCYTLTDWQGFVKTDGLKSTVYRQSEITNGNGVLIYLLGGNIYDFSSNLPMPTRLVKSSITSDGQTFGPTKVQPQPDPTNINLQDALINANKSQSQIDDLKKQIEKLKTNN